MPRTILLAAGTHALYGARAKSPDFHKMDDKKQGNFTLHHSLPYRYPFFVGFIFERLIATHASWQGSPGGARLLGRMVKIYNSLSPFAAVSESGLLGMTGVLDTGQQPRLGHHFAWMGCNLFVGPSGTWRIDDPHDGPEELKPQSFDAKRWEALFTLYRFIETYVYAFDDTAHTASTVELVVEEGGFVEGFLLKLEALAASGRDAHPFTPDDWIILDSDHAKWAIAQGMLSRSAEGLKNSHVRQAFMDVLKADEAKAKDKREVDFYRPVTHRNVTFGGQATPQNWAVLWRLRKDGERIPELKYKANFLVQ